MPLTPPLVPPPEEPNTYRPQYVRDLFPTGEELPPSTDEVLRRNRTLVPVCSDSCGLAYYSGLPKASAGDGYAAVTGSVPHVRTNPRHKHIPSHVIS